MTEKERLIIKYLTYEDIESVYKIFQSTSLKMSEPIPDWFEVKKTEIENLVAIPQMVFSGKELPNHRR